MSVSSISTADMFDDERLATGPQLRGGKQGRQRSPNKNFIPLNPKTTGGENIGK